MGGDQLLAIFGAVVIASAIYSGIKEGIRQSFNPPQPKEKPKPEKLPKPEPVAPPGKMWVRVGKQDLLIDSSLSVPRPKPARRTRKVRR